MVRDRVLLEGMVFFGYHGVATEEKSLGQRFIIDLALTVDLSEAGRSDDLTATVHYGHIYKLVKRIAEGPAFNLIEALGEAIAQAILTDYSKVEEVFIRVRKPEAPITGVLAGAAVELVRGRPRG